MNNNQDGINIDLRVHPDVFINQDGNNDKSNYLNDTRTRTRTRSNSGSIFESTSNIIRNRQSTMIMSQSYGGGRSSSFLLRQSDFSPASRLYM